MKGEEARRHMPAAGSQANSGRAASLGSFPMSLREFSVPWFFLLTRHGGSGQLGLGRFGGLLRLVKETGGRVFAGLGETRRTPHSCPLANAWNLWTGLAKGMRLNPAMKTWRGKL